MSNRIMDIAITQIESMARDDMVDLVMAHGAFPKVIETGYKSSEKYEHDKEMFDLYRWDDRIDRFFQPIRLLRFRIGVVHVCVQRFCRFFHISNISTC